MEPKAPNWALAGELLLAVADVWPTKALGKADARKALGLLKEWRDEIRTLLEGGAPTKPKKASAVAFLGTWRRINDDEGEAAELAAQDLNTKEIVDAFKDARGRALAHLKGAFKPIKLAELAGPRLLEPGISQLQRAAAIRAMVGDPGRVVYGLRAGQLSPDGLAVLEDVYPAILKKLRELVGLELMRQRTRRANYRCPWLAEIALRFLLDAPFGATPEKPSSPADQDPGQDVPDIQVGRGRNPQALTGVDRLSEEA